MVAGFRRKFLLLLTGVIFFAPLLTITSSNIALAAQKNPQDQLERWLYYRGMRACLEEPYFEKGSGGDDDEVIPVSDINEGHLYIQDSKAGVGGVGLFGTKTEGFGYLAQDLDGLDGEDGTVDCRDGSIWVRGAKIFGFPNVISLICAMNNALDELGDGGRIDPRRDGGKCINAQEVFFNGGSSIFQQALTKALEGDRAKSYGGDGDRPKFDFNDNTGPGYSHSSLLYLLGKNSLETYCGGSIGDAKPNDSYNDDEFGVSVYILNKKGELKESGVGEAGFSHTYVITKKDNENDNVSDVYYSNGGNPNEADDRSCADMARWTREGARDYAFWAKDNPELFEDTESGSPGDSDGGVTEESTTSCAIDGIGWMICPVMNFLALANEKAYGFLQRFLEIQPSLVQDDATIKAWSSFRDLANIAFVIAFLVIIYSQITSVGISNYGIKKMLPKIAAAAILVNLSLFICQLLVDVSNIAGSSFYSFITGVVSVPVDGGGSGGAWTSIMTGVLAAGVGILLIVAIIAAPTILLALGLILLILIARQAFIVILVIISPLAFVAYLLPNTEGLFKKWWKGLYAALLVYPIIAVVFGASTLASNILMGVANDATGEEDKQLFGIVALAVMAIPLFAVPALLKGAMAGAGSIGARLANLQDRANRRASGDVKNRASAELKDIGNRFTNRALSSTSRRGAVARAITGVGRRARRDDRYKQNQTIRDAAQENFLNQGIDPNDPTNTQGLSKSAERRVNAGSAKSTADATNQLINNMGVASSQDKNAKLHQAVAESNADLHHKQDLNKNIGETRYYKNPKNADHIAEGIEAKENRQSAETNAYNYAKTNYAGVQEAIINNKASQAEGKIIDQNIELNYQGSDIGRDQSVRLKAVEGNLDIVHAEQKNDFESSADGTAQAQRKKVLQGEAKLIEGDAQLEYELSDEGVSIEKANLGVQSQINTAQTISKAEFAQSRNGQALNLESAVAQATLGAVEAANRAQVEELKAGADRAGVVGTSLEQVANDLSIADIEKRAQEQRATSAQGMATEEYAKQVVESEGITGGLAEVAGGIDSYGARRAVSTATQVEIERFNKNVATEKSTMTSMKQDDWMDIVKDPNQSDERRAAAAGKIMQGASMGAIHELYNYTMSMDPSDSTDPSASKEAKSRANIQMQMGGDLSREPFGMGDTDASALRRGGLTPDGVFYGIDSAKRAAIEAKIQSPTDQSKPITHYDVMLGKRAAKKMGPQALVKMDPDDRGRYAALIESAVGGGDGALVLDPSAQENIANAIRAVASNESTKGIPKTDAKADYNRILRALGQKELTEDDWK